MESWLHHIETESGQFGMNLNRSKCVHIAMYTQERIRFKSGEKVPSEHEATYLGCNINDKLDVAREVNDRIKVCMATWRRLDVFWKQSNCPIRFKLQAFDAIIRSKLVYGL